VAGVLGDDPQRDGQAEPGAGGGGRVAAAVEAFEDPFGVLGWDAQAAVGDADLGVAVLDAGVYLKALSSRIGRACSG